VANQSINQCHSGRASVAMVREQVGGGGEGGVGEERGGGDEDEGHPLCGYCGQIEECHRGRASLANQGMSPGLPGRGLSGQSSKAPVAIQADHLGDTVLKWLSG